MLISSEQIKLKQIEIIEINKQIEIFNKRRMSRNQIISDYINHIFLNDLDMGGIWIKKELKK